MTFLNLLRRAPLYVPLRDAYNWLMRPKVAAGRRRMRAFFSEFVRPGNLVFDVGANNGAYAEVFGALGARVVAVEPNGVLLSEIRARVPAAEVVEAAVGSQNGTVDLWISPEDDHLSTASDRFADLIREGLVAQLESRLVRMVTLDTLADEHGQPDFVKIDVEGLERDVLLGMTFRPAALSFEFHVSLAEELPVCLDLLVGYEFRVSLGFEYTWATAWTDRDGVLAFVDQVAHTRDRWAYGDVYARRVDG